MTTGAGHRGLYRGREIGPPLQTVTLADGAIARRDVALHRGTVTLQPLLNDDHDVRPTRAASAATTRPTGRP